MASGAKRNGFGMNRSALAGLRFSASKFHFPPSGSSPVHQKPGLASHLAIEELHPQRLATVRPSAELVPRADEALVRQDRDRQPSLRLPGIDQLAHPPLTGFRHDNAAGPRLSRDARHLTREAAAVLSIVEPHIAHGPPVSLQFGCEVAHRRKQERNLLLVVPNVSRLLRHLGHDDDITRLVAGPKAGQVKAQLIAENGNERRTGGGRP